MILFGDRGALVPLLRVCVYVWVDLRRLRERGERFFWLGFYTLYLNLSCLDPRLLNFGPGHQNAQNKTTSHPWLLFIRMCPVPRRKTGGRGGEVSWCVSWDSQRCPHAACARLIRERKRKAKPSYFCVNKLFTCLVSSSNYKGSLPLWQEKSSVSRGKKKNLSPRTDNQIKLCYIFCLISTRNSITPLIKHIILLQKVSLIYAKSDLDILSPAMEIS